MVQTVGTAQACRDVAAWARIRLVSHAMTTNAFTRTPKAEVTPKLEMSLKSEKGAAAMSGKRSTVPRLNGTPRATAWSATNAR